MSNLVIEHVQKTIIKENINILRISIYRIKLLIAMHKKIGEKSNIKYQNFYGFMQHNLIVGAVVVEIFSIFDKNKNGLLKKFRKILEKNNISVFTSELLDKWRELIPFPVEIFISGFFIYAAFCKFSTGEANSKSILVMT